MMRFFDNFIQMQYRKSNQMPGKLTCGIFLVLIAFSFTGSQAFAQTNSGDSSYVVAKGVSSDGSVYVTIISTPIELHKPLAIQISFTDAKGTKISHENYAIIAVQQEGNGIAILSNATAYTVNGDDVQVTLLLDNTSPIDFQVTLEGVGQPGTDPSTWTGQKGEIINLHLVPEFGFKETTVFMIAVFGATALTTKLKHNASRVKDPC